MAKAPMRPVPEGYEVREWTMPLPAIAGQTTEYRRKWQGYRTANPTDCSRVCSRRLYALNWCLVDADLRAQGVMPKARRKPRGTPIPNPPPGYETTAGHDRHLQTERAS